MPLQAFNTDANGTMFHNMFSPKILANKQCYLNSQIQTVRTSILNSGNNRYGATTDYTSSIGFIPDFSNETFTPPVNSSNRRLIRRDSGYIDIVTGIGSLTSLMGAATLVPLTDTSTTLSTFAVFNSKALATISFYNTGSSFTSVTFSCLGIFNNPLFMTDLTNTRLNNYFGFAVNNANVFSGTRLQDMTSTNKVSFRTTASSSNYTFQCAIDSGDGTTVSGLWATHLALVDSTAAPNDFCIGTVPPIVLLGRGAYTLGNIYKFNNVGEGLTNDNAYDRWYVAGPTYGSGGDRLLMQVYYEP